MSLNVRSRSFKVKLGNTEKVQYEVYNDNVYICNVTFSTAYLCWLVRPMRQNSSNYLQNVARFLCDIAEFPVKTYRQWSSQLLNTKITVSTSVIKSREFVCVMNRIVAEKVSPGRSMKTERSNCRPINQLLHKIFCIIFVCLCVGRASNWMFASERRQRRCIAEGNIYQWLYTFSCRYFCLCKLGGDEAVRAMVDWLW